MGLVAPSKRRERQLIYAIEKVGKTTCYLTICEKVDKTFWIADGDNAFYANAEEFPSIDVDAHYPIIPVEWSDYVTWADDVIESAKDDDWVIIDRIDHMREAAIDNYIERVYEQKASEWYLAATRERKAQLEDKKKKNQDGGVAPVLEMSDWQVINGYYYSLLNRLNARLRSQHLLICANAKELATKGMMRDSRQINKYSEVGWVPEGGRKLAPIPSTILFIKQVGDNRFISTVGDRGREKNKKLKNVRLNDFAIDYLMKVAGWHNE